MAEVANVMERLTTSPEKPEMIGGMLIAFLLAAYRALR
jgi:hypothetical protein